MYGVQTDRQSVGLCCGLLRADDSAGVVRGGEAHRSLPAQRGAALSHELRCCRLINRMYTCLLQLRAHAHAQTARVYQSHSYIPRLPTSWINKKIYFIHYYYTV